MRAPPEQPDRQPDEREIRSLSDRSGVELAEVRTLFRHELARLGMGAKVDSYLAVLTASNVRGMLRRLAHRSKAAQVAQELPRDRSSDLAMRSGSPKTTDRGRPGLRRRPSEMNLQGWEDDGGAGARSSVD